MRCRYCDRRTPGGDHVECDDEYRRRHDRGLCVFCGDPRGARLWSRCDRCNDGVPDFVGYPGSAATRRRTPDKRVVAGPQGAA